MLRKDQILLTGVFSFYLLFYPGDNIYSVPINSGRQEILKQNPILDFKVSLYPVRRGLYPDPQISANSVYILDPNSGVVLFSKNADARRAPASTTKLMTALVALDNYKLDDILEVKKLVNDGKNMGLFYGEKMSLENLLYGALVDSANDAAYVIADNYSGGVDKFVDEMNKKAKQIGLSNTNFENPVGYDNPGQYITAKDLAVLSLYALNNPLISHIVGTKSITVADADYKYFHYLENVNELLGEVPGVAGVKTGFTRQAGENLATLVKRDGKEIIVVVLKSKDRFGDTKKLISWVFGEYVWQSVY